MNDNSLTLPECDGALFNQNVIAFPATELAKYAGCYVAWSLDGTRILASGSTYEEFDRSLAAAGLRSGLAARCTRCSLDRPLFPATIPMIATAHSN